MALPSLKVGFREFSDFPMMYKICQIPLQGDTELKGTGLGNVGIQAMWTLIYFSVTFNVVIYITLVVHNGPMAS